MRALASLLCLALAQQAFAGPSEGQAVPEVTISAVRSPVSYTYRSLLAGQDAFEKDRELAPAAPALQFLLRKRGGGPVEAPQAVKLRIASDTESLPVAVAEDGMFSLPRNESLFDDKADVIIDLKRKSYNIAPQVRTPGLPANVRRLGDLRLECRAGVAIGKELIPFWVTASVNTLLLTTNWCGHEKMVWPSFSNVRIAGAVITHEGKSLQLEARDWEFTAPIGDTAWPDDALVELTVAP